MTTRGTLDEIARCIPTTATTWGELTQDDPISFSGTICFVDGMTDAAACFGDFNRKNQVEKFDEARSDVFSPVARTLGVAIADSPAVGYDFQPQVTSAYRAAEAGAWVEFDGIGPRQLTGRSPCSSP